MTFTQPGQVGRKGLGRDNVKEKCFSCVSIGNHAKDCPNGGEPDETKEGTDFSMYRQAKQLKMNTKGMLLEEGADLFNIVDGVKFLEVESRRRVTCDCNKAYVIPVE